MSSEDWRERVERQIAFIIGQQADSEGRWAKADERWARTEEGIRALLSIAEIHEREIGELREAALRTEQRLSALAEAGRATDESLKTLSEKTNALIDVVERHISEGHNGQR